MPWISAASGISSRSGEHDLDISMHFFQEFGHCLRVKKSCKRMRELFRIGQLSRFLNGIAHVEQASRSADVDTAHFFYSSPQYVEIEGLRNGGRCTVW